MSKDFKPQDHFRYKKLGKTWRKPKGLQSKLREGRKGAGARVKIGYGSPSSGKERGLMKARIVKTINDMENVREDESIILSASLGKKRVSEIYSEAQKRNIRILNMKSVDSAKKRAEEIRQENELKKLKKKEKAKTETHEKKKAETQEKQDATKEKKQ